MQISNTLAPKNQQTVQTAQNTNATSSSLSASGFIAQLGEEIASLFEELSLGVDEETKLKRALSLSLNLSAPLFMRFDEGNYPQEMPSDVKRALQDQRAGYEALESEKEQMIYKMDWMLDHIGFERSSDPGAEAFLRELRAAYAGSFKSDYQSRDEINDSDYALQQFRDDLSNKGAAKFLSDFNQEKIDALVEEYRKELEEMLKENPDLDIDKMLSDFKKSLMERLAELEEENERSPLNINKLAFEVTSKFDTKLEDILL